MIWIRFLSIAVAITAMSCSVAAQTSLSGGIEQNNILSEIRVGDIWDETLPSRVPKHDYWFPIPKWSAGEWVCKEQRDLYTGAISHWLERRRYGLIQDAEGRIWDCWRFPFTRDAKTKGFSRVDIFTEGICTSSEMDKEVLQTQGRVITINKRNHRVVGAVKMLATYTWRPLDEQSFLCDRHYTNSGLARRSIFYRTATFTPTTDVELKQSFEEYSYRSGHPELIPWEHKD